MKPKITLVVDRPSLELGARRPDAASRWAKYWGVEDIARSLVAHGVDAPVFTGSFSDAPESWAYLLLAGGLTDVVENPVVRARLPRTIGLISIREACRDADRFGLAGAIDERGVPDPDNDTPQRLNFICVRLDIAEKLGWELLGPISSPYRYEGIWGLPIPIGQLILTYLRALLGDPADASPPSPPPA